jgi:hypothetical protein
VYAPPMDYRDHGLFDRVLKEVKENDIDLLIGSSMGGWFAYCISTITGIPALLFNPAVQGRSFDPYVKSGNKRSKHTVVLGKMDEVIDPNKSLSWFTSNGVGSQSFTWENMEHRIPINIFTKWVKSMNRVNEEWSTESPGTGGEFLNILPEAVVQTLIPNFLTARPPVGNLTVEDENELFVILNAQECLSEGDYKFIRDCNDSPPEVFYQWLTLRGERPSMKELKDMWKDPENIRTVDQIKKMYKRSRPYETVKEVTIDPGITTDDYSFPSGHACGSMYIATMLAKKYPHLSDGLYHLANRIANTRIQAGVHYPSDVEAGKAIGKMLASR